MVFVAVFAVLAPLGVSDAWGPFIAAAAQAAAHLGIGWALLNEAGTEDPSHVATDATQHDASWETAGSGRRA